MSTFVISLLFLSAPHLAMFVFLCMTVVRELIEEISRAGLIVTRKHAFQVRVILLGQFSPYFVTDCDLALRDPPEGHMASV
jgi:hypothetical protein